MRMTAWQVTQKGVSENVNERKTHIVMKARKRTKETIGSIVDEHADSQPGVRQHKLDSTFFFCQGLEIPIESTATDAWAGCCRKRVTEFA